jgi:hypothetical protein
MLHITETGFDGIGFFHLVAPEVMGDAVAPKGLAL